MDSPFLKHHIKENVITFLSRSVDRALLSVYFPAHLPTCPVCRRDGPSGNIFSSVQIGQNVGRSGIMLADGTSHLLTACLQIGQSVARWARQQMGRPTCQHFVTSADKMAHPGTFCPVCRLDKMSADWAKCSQMGLSHLATARLQIGQNVGILGKMLADGTPHLLTSRLQIGQSVARWDRHPYEEYQLRVVSSWRNAY